MGKFLLLQSWLLWLKHLVNILRSGGCVYVLAVFNGLEPLKQRLLVCPPHIGPGSKPWTLEMSVLEHLRQTSPDLLQTSIKNLNLQLSSVSQFFLESKTLLGPEHLIWRYFHSELSVNLADPRKENHPFPSNVLSSCHLFYCRLGDLILFGGLLPLCPWPTTHHYQIGWAGLSGAFPSALNSDSHEPKMIHCWLLILWKNTAAAMNYNLW